MKVNSTIYKTVYLFIKSFNISILTIGIRCPVTLTGQHRRKGQAIGLSKARKKGNKVPKKAA